MYYPFLITTSLVINTYKRYFPLPWPLPAYIRDSAMNPWLCDRTRNTLTIGYCVAMTVRFTRLL